MPEPLQNPLVAINNAREDATATPIQRAGRVLHRPEGELKLLWLLYAKLIDREIQARKQSNRKQRREKRA